MHPDKAPLGAFFIVAHQSLQVKARSNTVQQISVYNLRHIAEAIVDLESRK
jgi:hypothetical protein